MLVKRATKALEVKQTTETTVKPATCQQQNISIRYKPNNKNKWV